MDGSLKNICADYICCLWIITRCMQNEIMQVSIGKWTHFQVQKGDWQWYRKQLKQSSCSSSQFSKQQQMPEDCGVFHICWSAFPPRLPDILQTPSPADYDSVCSGVRPFPLQFWVEESLSHNCVHVSSICQGGHHFHLLGGEKGKEM